MTSSHASRHLRLNPFENRAGFKQVIPAGFTLQKRLNPFENRAGFKLNNPDYIFNFKS